MFVFGCIIIIIVIFHKFKRHFSGKRLRFVVSCCKFSPGVLLLDSTQLSKFDMLVYYTQNVAGCNVMS